MKLIVRGWRDYLVLLLFIIVLVLTGILLLRGQWSEDSPGRARVFIGWLENSDYVQIRLLNGAEISYSGDRLKGLTEELKAAVKALENQQEETRRKDEKKKRKEKRSGQ